MLLSGLEAEGKRDVKGGSEGDQQVKMKLDHLREGANHERERRQCDLSELASISSSVSRHRTVRHRALTHRINYTEGQTASPLP